jgi:hypothetical protein
MVCQADRSYPLPLSIHSNPDRFLLRTSNEAFWGARSVSRKTVRVARPCSLTGPRVRVSMSLISQ